VTADDGRGGPVRVEIGLKVREFVVEQFADVAVVGLQRDIVEDDKVPAFAIEAVKEPRHLKTILEKSLAIARVIGQRVGIAGPGEVVITEGPMGGNIGVVFPELKEVIEGGFRAGEGEIAAAVDEVAAAEDEVGAGIKFLDPWTERKAPPCKRCKSVRKAKRNGVALAGASGELCAKSESSPPMVSALAPRS